MSYTCFIIDAEFTSRDETVLDRVAFSRSLADWVMGGGEFGIWKVDEGKTILTVVGLYAKAAYKSRLREGETLTACWAMSEYSASFAEDCCGCGCNSTCDKCSCCCETCDCGDCKCCCDCG